MDVPATTAPTPPPVAPPVVKTTTPVDPRPPVLVAFQPRLGRDAPERAKRAAHAGAAARRRAVGGDRLWRCGPPATPPRQPAALPLALARARAIAAMLTASGVPSALVRVDAEAEGRGGAARIAN